MSSHSKGPPEHSDAAGRRAARARWPIQRYALGEEPSEDLSAHTTASERLAMVWPLTVLSWRLAGREIPTYERRDMPGRLVPQETRD